MRRLVVLGAGTAGTMVANKLRRRLAREQWQITVVDRDDRHLYQPGLLFIPFGVYRPDEVTKPRTRFLPDGVDFVLGDIDRVEPDSKVVLLVDGTALPYDYLVIASGTSPRPDQTPGMLGPHGRSRCRRTCPWPASTNPQRRSSHDRHHHRCDPGPRRRRRLPHRLRRVGRATRPAARRADRHRADRRALAGDPVPTRGLPDPGRDRHVAPGVHPRRDTGQGVVRAVPRKAGQEDGLHRRAAQAPRLRVTKEGIAMTTTTPRGGPAVVPDFGDDTPTGRKLAIICSKGNLDMAYPGLILANAALGEGVETHLFFTFWGFDMI